MHTYAAFAAIAGTAAALTPFATPSQTKSAPGTIPTGCSTDYPSLFQIQAVNATSASKAKRQSSDGTLIVELINGIITSTVNATAEVAGDNHQFQFSTPQNNGQPQPGFLYDAGFSACANGTLAHGDSAVWYECNGGARNIIADINIYGNQQCYPIFLQIVPYGGAGATPSQTVTVTGTSSVAPSVTTATPITKSPDGQPNPVASPTVKTSSAAVVTAISDNQPQAPKPTAVLTAISDNQPQAPTPARTPYGTASPSRYTGAAAQATAGPMVAAVVGAAALALF